MNYKQQLEHMLVTVDIMTRLRIHQAREWDSLWYEGVYYAPVKPNPALAINSNIF